MGDSEFKMLSSVPGASSTRQREREHPHPRNRRAGLGIVGVGGGSNCVDSRVDPKAPHHIAQDRGPGLGWEGPGQPVNLRSWGLRRRKA